MTETKVCSRCGEKKDISNFGIANGYKGGRRSQCKRCHADQSAELRRKKLSDKNKLCAIDGCDKPECSRGYCLVHYARLVRHGNPLGGGPKKDKRIGSCKVNGCEMPIYGKGLCRKHWQRWKKNGDPNIVGRTPKGTILTWLEENKAYEGDDCLVWPFSRKDDGYGTCHIRDIGMSASRAMCIIAHGDPPSANYHAAHRCGNGDKGCVNPNHLRWATPAENCDDMVDHGTRIQGEGCWMAKLTESDVRIIRSRYPREMQKTLAVEYGVSRATIGDVLLGRTWKHVR